MKKMKLIAFRVDDNDYDLLEALKDAGFNKSELLRQALNEKLRKLLEE